MEYVRQTEYPLLGPAVSGAMERQHLSHGDVAGRYFQELGFTVPSSASDWLHHIKAGRPYATTGPRVQDPRKRLVQLARLLFFLEIPEADPVISGLREFDPRFVYPPAERR